MCYNVFVRSVRFFPALRAMPARLPSLPRASRGASMGHAVLLTAPAADPRLPPVYPEQRRATVIESTLIGMLQVFIPNNLKHFRMKKISKNPHFAQFWCNVSPFRINTSKSVSKQTTLSPFRINTYEKQGEGGGSPQTVNRLFLPSSPLDAAVSNSAPRHSSLRADVYSDRVGAYSASAPAPTRSGRYPFPFFDFQPSTFNFLPSAPLAPQQVLEISHLFPDQIQLPRHPLNFGLRTTVHGVVQFTAHAILHVLAVLAHHDDRRLDRREQRQNEIQQDKRIGIQRRLPHTHVDRRVDAAQDEKTNDKGPRPAELHHGVRDPLGQRRLRLDHFVCIAHRTQTHQLLRRMELFSQHGQHIHSRVRLAFQQRQDICPADFQALRILDGRRARLMRRALQHRSETKKLAVRRLIHHNFLLVFVHRRDPHFSGDHHVGWSARVTHLVNALPRREILKFHLRSQHRCLVFIEQRKQRNVFQHFRITTHRPPLRKELDCFLVFQAFASNATGNCGGSAFRLCPFLCPHSRPDHCRGFKQHSEKESKDRRGEMPRLNADTSLDDLNFHVLRGGMLRQQRGHSLRPALESLWAAERNDNRKHLLRCRHHHGSFRIARRATVRTNRVGKQRQSFQVQVEFADALVRFAGASRAKNNFAHNVPDIIQPNPHPPFHD